MSRTITALFDSRDDAEAGKNRLQAANIDISSLTVADQSTAGYSAEGYSTHEDKGLWASIKGAFLPDEDRHHYEEGVRRGGYLLSGEIADDHADEAVRILDEANSVDIEGRASDWRSSGWDYTPPAASGAQRAYGADAGEQSIPIVEEQLRVGKREVDRGGVSVRSYVVETPVSEQVNLREETVSVERRAVDKPLSAADSDVFRERTIEMTETAEEAVVAKDARIVEEVVIRKDVDNRTETVNDTVRRTEVEIDDTAGETRTGYADGAGYDANASDDVSLGDKVAGLAKEGAGKLTGNDELERRGEAQQARLTTRTKSGVPITGTPAACPRSPLSITGVRECQERSCHPVATRPHQQPSQCGAGGRC